MEVSEEVLSRKLLAKLHLSVPERQSLPEGRIRFSILVGVVQGDLAESGWFPSRLEPGQNIGSGAVLESRNGEIWIHEQHEIGVLRYSPVDSHRVTDVAEAVRAYVKANGCSPIDGIEIDWAA